MNNRLKSIITVTVFAVFLLSVSVLCLAMPDTTHSDSERRELAQLPKVTTQKLVSGEFSKEFESYTTDQFPFRDALRSIKTLLAHKVLGKLDNNGLFTADGHISKLDAAINEPMMDHAAERFNYIYNTYLTDNNVYFSIVPDKNYVLAKANGFPAMNYESFIDKMAQKVPNMKYIDICDLLSATDYYNTDTHWRQENITDVATRLARHMGVNLTHDYTENTLDVPFYGVYAGQYAGGVVPDTIKYLTNDTINNAKVSAYNDKGMLVESSIYNLEKAKEKDPYEMFLSGTMAVVTIENPNATLKRELVLFRDSYGSSIAPLFLSGYSKITVVDTRYIQSEYLKAFVDFDGADVLFLYSTSLLNNSLAIR